MDVRPLYFRAHDRGSPGSTAPFQVHPAAAEGVPLAGGGKMIVVWKRGGREASRWRRASSPGSREPNRDVHSRVYSEIEGNF